MAEYIEAPPDADRAEVNDQMLRLTTSTQLAHLRNITEDESGAIPEPSPEDGGPAGLTRPAELPYPRQLVGMPIAVERVAPLVGI